MDTLLAQISSLPLGIRLLIFAGFAVATHMIVSLVRHLASMALHRDPNRRYRKLQSLTTLVTSAVVFTLYFLALGLILREFGVSLTAYLASASVIGLAIGFGSQGVVQDVVTGLTFIFSDLVDVGDLVEISGQTGLVKGITMRFIELENALGASVFIPNRTINNVINYPRGYVRCIVDVTLLGDEDSKLAAIRTATTLMQATHEQFPGILIAAPSVEGRVPLTSSREILRIKFRIWPNRGQPIESVYVQELTAALKQQDSSFQSWMIAVTYEVEKKTARPNSNLSWPWRR